MALSGWHWTIFGGIIAAVSGIVYITTNKSGDPNLSMALFFFIGIVFLIIGVLKLFFRRVDDSKIFDAAKRSEEGNSFHALQQNQIQAIQNAPKEPANFQLDTKLETNLNKVDEAIAKIAKEHEEKHKQAHHQERQQMHSGHTNSYFKMHGYKGLDRSENTSANAQHPIHAHAQQKIVNTATHSIKCRRCGNVNSGTSNYCHSCGNRLK